MKTLITQTLLGSWLYQFNCAEGYEEDAEADFLLTLKREPKEPTDAMAEGIQFENGVYALMKDPKDLTVYPPWSDISRKLADALRGGQVQVKVLRDIRVGDEDYLLHGVVDVLKAGVIYDLKFTTSSFTSADLAGKYLNSPQHPAYLYCLPDALRFTYLVSDGKSLYTETYSRNEITPIGETIAMFRQDIRKRGLEDIYLEKWGAK